MKAFEALRKPFRYSFYNVTFYLVAINVIVFFLTAFVPNLFGALSLRARDVLYAGRFWQVLTYMFCHGGMTHLLFNMIGLYMFGSQVERRVGSTEFLLFYLLNGALVGLFLVGINAAFGVNASFVGASGAIFALLLAFAAFFPDTSVFLFGILPLRAPVLVVGYALIEIVSQVFALGAGISHLGHLAGFGFAYLYFLVRYGINPWSRFFLR
jgi:membrane associated rhomboid family serine protease